jgi:hypothetical protein
MISLNRIWLIGIMFYLFYGLHFFIKQRRATHFVWLFGSGTYHGELNFGAQHR